MHASRAPRILFCTDTYPPQVNGVSVVTALSVAGLAQRGWDCAVIAPRYPAAVRDAFAGHDAYQATTAGAALASTALPFYPDIRLAAPDAGTVAACFRRFQPDLVHCETEFVIGWLGQRAALRRGIPVTSSYHTDFARYTDAYSLGWLKPRVREWIARFHRRSAFTVTPSEPARQDLLAMRVPQALVWGRGVDIDTFHPDHRSTALRVAYGRPDTFIFLHVGRLAAEKGTERIVRAYEIVRGQLPEGAVHLVIAGAGPCEQDLRARMTEGVTYLGNLDRQTILPRLYASADAFVFASLTETLGLA
jgi:glycosyltransferase involved in cell wall biosynthesis